jgi:hypothetical protein
MSVLRTPGVTDAFGSSARVADRARAPAPARAHSRVRARARRGVAMLVYSTGYPLLALALWTGARNGNWERASALVALGVVMSFVGWGLLSVIDDTDDDEASPEFQRGAVVTSMFLALYNRAGAIVVLLGSYAVAATTQGWPTPQTFIGWFALVWIPLFVSFAIPVECANRRRDPDL